MIAECVGAMGGGIGCRSRCGTAHTPLYRELGDCGYIVTTIPACLAGGVLERGKVAILRPRDHAVVLG